MRLSILSCVLCCLAACGSPADVSVDFVEAQVLNGTLDTEVVGDAVVSIHDRSNGLFSDTPSCAGTLVSTNTILTAAHCVANKSTADIGIHFGISSLGASQASFRSVAEVRIADGYLGTGENDVALLRLATPELTVPPRAILPDGLSLDASHIGGTLRIAGFGITELGTRGTRYHSTNTLGAFGCGVSGCPGVPTSEEIATQLSYTQFQQGPCSFDSGGPAMMAVHGGNFVVGVTSDGDVACTQYGYSMRVDAYSDWIQDTINEWTTDVLPLFAELTELSASGSVQLRYRIVLPTDAPSLVVELREGVGDGDLYVRADQHPTTSAFDCASATGGNDERCTLSAPGAGDYFVLVHPYAPFGGAKLRAWTTSGCATSGGSLPSSSGWPLALCLIAGVLVLRRTGH